MNESVIDRAVFDELRTTTGPEFVAELVGTFLEEAPSLLTELRKARTDGDVARFRRAAHSLKSNGNTFGALQLAATARDLELKGLDRDPARDTATLAILDTMYAEAAAELKALSHG